MHIIEYVSEEVRRQGHDLQRTDGIERVAWMLEGWLYAMRAVNQGAELPTLDDVIRLGQFIEPHYNYGGVRVCDVSVGTHLCPRPKTINRQLVSLFESISFHKPLEFYKAFEEIHPFIDGNGRTGKIILNWMNGSLLDPIFPPKDLWGREIENP